MSGLLSKAVRLLNSPFVVDEAAQPADAIVVLGAPLGKDGQLTEVTKERVAEAVGMFEQGLAPLLVFTGGVTASNRSYGSEAGRMRDYALALGIPEEKVLAEEESLSTYENAFFCRRMLDANIRRVWLVSTPFHLRRSRYWFRMAGFEALAWNIEDSVQYERATVGLKWTLREYCAWGNAAYRTTLHYLFRRGR